MKSPFSPWGPYVVMIALCCAFAAFVEFERSALPHWLWRTNAVVRSLRGDAPVKATVALDSGSVADAEVAPGCLVQVGDRVFVSRSTDTEAEKLLVFPADMGVSRLAR